MHMCVYVRFFTIALDNRSKFHLQYKESLEPLGICRDGVRPLLNPCESVGRVRIMGLFLNNET